MRRFIRDSTCKAAKTLASAMPMGNNSPIYLFHMHLQNKNNLIDLDYSASICPG